MSFRSVARRIGLLVTALIVGITSLVVSSGTAYAALPLCTRHDSVGPEGTVTAQVNQAGQVVWGVVMRPPSKAVGVWNFDTYFNGKKSISGFHRTLTGPYTPHGFTPESRPGGVWSAKGYVLAGNMEYHYIVGDPCYIPK